MKSLQILKISWESYTVYRLNFLMWRLRQNLELLTRYFLWLAIFSQNQPVLGYQKSQMLTYIIGTSVIATMVTSVRSINAAGEISSGDLTNYLLKPINYIRFWAVRDIADKLLNMTFLALEIPLVIWLLKTPLALPTALPTWILFIIAIILSTVLFYYFSFLISLTGFWYPEHGGWPARFLFNVLVQSLAGGLFPLDILPSQIYSLIKVLPTTYLLYFPMQIFLERINQMQLIIGVLIMTGWILILRILVNIFWQKGLQTYGAYGR